MLGGVLLTFLCNIKWSNSCKIKDYSKHFVKFGMIEAYNLTD